MRYLVVLLLAGCATTSQVVPHGTDGYLVNVDDPSGSHSTGALQRMAIAEATRYCEKQGKMMRVREATSSGAYGWTGTSANLVFACAEK